jgi:hypothetical protein
MPVAKNSSVADPACEHIDCERLYTDIQYRFQYLAKFSDFGEADIEAIHDAAPLVAPLVPAIIDAVYLKLFAFDSTKAVFLQRNENYQGELAAGLNDLHLDNDQIKFRKDFLGKYLAKLVTAKYDADFVKYLDYVGKVHTSHGTKKSRINVEYVHCSALFTFVSSFIVNALMSADLPKDVLRRTVVAFNKLLWIQNDFFAKWYVRDADYHGDGKIVAGSSDGAAMKTAGLVSGAAVLGALAMKLFSK